MDSQQEQHNLTRQDATMLAQILKEMLQLSPTALDLCVNVVGNIRDVEGSFREGVSLVERWVGGSSHNEDDDEIMNEC